MKEYLVKYEIGYIVKAEDEDEARSLAGAMHEANMRLGKGIYFWVFKDGDGDVEEYKFPHRDILFGGLGQLPERFDYNGRCFICGYLLDADEDCHYCDFGLSD